MSKKSFLFLICSLLLLVVLCGCAAEPAAEEQNLFTPEPAATPAPTAPPSPRLVELSIADQSSHPALMSVNEKGCFEPHRRVSRLEACEGLVLVLDGLVAGHVDIADMEPGSEGYAEVTALYRAGLLEWTEGESFSPNDGITRTEMAEILSRTARCLAGTDAQRVTELAADVGAGATNPEGEPQSRITRAELAVILERLAGREPNEAALWIGGYAPADVDTETYAWAWIADAVAAGEVPSVEAGAYRVRGMVYGTDGAGSLLRDTDYGVWTFGLDGRYTTGDVELDGHIRQVLESCGADGLSAQEALEAAYLYVKYNYTYLVMPEDMQTEEPGATGWENERALRFFRNGGGTCYGFAAAFGLLARALGEDAYIVSAQVNEYYAPHGFVVIPVDGVDWIYDVEMEATRMERHPDLDLFCIRNFQIYNYWYAPDW